MVLKVKAFEGSREKIIPFDDILARHVMQRDIFEIPTDIVGNQITLTAAPLEYSESVVLNGLELTDGLNYDYTISGQVITFNSGVLTQTGHIKVKYLSL